MMRNWNGKLLSLVAVLAFVFLSGCSKKVDQGQLAQDRLDCQNLMSLHSWYHSAFMNDVELDQLWAKEAKDIVFAQNSGFWQGQDKVKAYYGVSAKDKSLSAGHFQMHTITTAVIEVAEDRKTAKGIFYTPGMVGAYNAGGWMWERYGVDFINENGTWKIWHLHVYSDFSASFGKDLSAGAPAPGGGAPATPTKVSGKAEKFGMESADAGKAPGGAPAGGGAPGGAPAGGGAAGSPNGRQVAPGVWLTTEAMTPSYTAKEGYKELGKDTIAVLIPTPPRHYKTFSETISYADPDEYAKGLAAIKAGTAK
jgi:hypothetical protein